MKWKKKEAHKVTLTAGAVRRSLIFHSGSSFAHFQKKNPRIKPLLPTNKKRAHAEHPLAAAGLMVSEGRGIKRRPLRAARGGLEGGSGISNVTSPSSINGFCRASGNERQKIREPVTFELGGRRRKSSGERGNDRHELMLLAW